ncbi:LPXTG cell wall anchor domain-containing protein [Streptomyces sp. NPDC029526]|uniref:LPXTG cell wall anchor domain-containing protein n=1 Tax=Streptomyces sp. NPDC029526 TaxID=3155728 RepID=UPI0034060A6D
MTKKTRVRVARIAAGAVVAAGASLMVAGVAQADPIVPDPSCGIVGTDPACEDDGGEPGNPGGGDGEPGNPGGGDGEPGNPGGGDGDEEPGNPGGGDGEPGIPGGGDGGEEPGNPGGGDEDPIEEPTEKPTTPGDKGDDDAGTTPAGGNGPSAQDQGSSALTDTGDAPATSAQGSGDELAETGAAEMTFLVIGAATMIAGGIGFRVLPRLMTGRGGAAA